MSYYQPTHQFQGIQGPTDPQLPMTELEGYQPVSRIGEVVINSFGTRMPPPPLRHGLP